jgi:nitrous oxide reductase accessory protein NosL
MPAVMRALAVVATLLAWSAAGEEPSLPQPGPRDLCPVCGMLVSKYPHWVAIVLYRDGHAVFFDGAKDMFKYLQDLVKYAPERHGTDIVATYVTEFYGLTRIDARKAYYVIGSDVFSPMGYDLVPLASLEDATEFVKDHKGARVLRFEEVTRDIIDQLDRNKPDRR